MTRRWTGKLGRSVLVLAGLAGGSAACSGPADPRCEYQTTPSVDVSEWLDCNGSGVGALGVVPLAGDRYGVRLSLYVSGIYLGDTPTCGEPEDPIVVASVQIEGTTVGTAGRDCPIFGQLKLPVVLGDDPAELLGRTAHVEVEVRDLCGRTEIGTMEAVLVDPPGPDAGVM